MKNFGRKSSDTEDEKTPFERGRKLFLTRRRRNRVRLNLPRSPVGISPFNAVPPNIFLSLISGYTLVNFESTEAPSLATQIHRSPWGRPDHPTARAIS